MMFFIKKILNTVLIISNYSPIVLLWMIKALSIDWIARKWSFSKLPKIASEIGLKHKPSDVLKEFGELHGNIHGHNICVKPDNHMDSLISVDFVNTYKGLHISLPKPHRRLDKNIVDFKTPDWKFNWTFKTKRSHKDMARKISENHELITLLNSFYYKWIFKLDGLNISNNDIYCTLKYGFNFSPYIPVSKLKSLVSELIAIAERIDPIET